MQGNNLKDQDASKLNRRKFLTKTGASFFIASMPAKSVWGACSVSGALSGNLSQNNDRHSCEKPRVIGGRSPGGWKNFQSGKRKGKVKAFFSNATDRTISCFDKEVSIVMNSVLPLPTDLVRGSETVKSCLASNGSGNSNIVFHLSAVYLNALFGFYPGVSSSNAADYVKQIYTDWHVRNVILNLSDRVDDYFIYREESKSSYIATIC